MMKTTLLLLVLVPGALSLVENAQERPVAKVVRLLQDMKVELTKELEDDQAVFELLDCWCQTGTKEKEAAIEAAEAHIDQLNALHGETLAKAEGTAQKREATWQQLQADQKSLVDAENDRMKAIKAFQKLSTDLMEAGKACQQAVTVLGKHHGEFLQQANSALSAAHVLELATTNGMSKLHIELLKEFLHDTEKPGASFLGIPGFQSHGSQSGQIFGILKQMQENFEEDLAETEKEDAKAAEEFAMLKARKEEEIAAAEKDITNLDAELAEYNEIIQNALKELKDTKAQLALDQEFLKNLDAKCKSKDEEFAKRKEDRMTEMKAVDDTIEILNSDQAYDQFGKTVNTFLQISTSEKAVRQHAAEVLSKAAGKTNAPKLALIAMSTQLDAFVEVIKKIDGLVAALTQQQKDEVVHRDECLKALNDNKLEQEDNQHQVDNLNQRIEELNAAIKAASEQKDVDVATVKETTESLRRATSNRAKESEDNKATVEDQRLTQLILAKALTRMQEVYGFLQQPGAAHTQTSGTHTDPGNGPAKFKEYEKNKGGSRIVAMIQDVINDSKKLEDETLFNEKDSQGAYEYNVQEGNRIAAQALQSINDQNAILAESEKELSQSKASLSDEIQRHDDLVNTNKAIHGGCDFVLDNFEVRQSKRRDELDALNEAKAILQGMK